MKAHNLLSQGLQVLQKNLVESISESVQSAGSSSLWRPGAHCGSMSNCYGREFALQIMI